MALGRNTLEILELCSGYYAHRTNTTEPTKKLKQKQCLQKNEKSWLKF